ncbi:MAG TPA: FAD-dependent oxidoreductase, partial [Candidatus Brocadiales bacterium]|nr:FAD-dependent oxidoreductase [Candidatus Brocadiales bacterium]
GGGFGPSTKWVILKEMKEAGIKSLTNIKVKAILANEPYNSGVIIERNGKKRFVKADTVVIAVGYAPDKELCSQFNRHDVYNIGDCVNVRTALEAVHEGFEAGFKL